MAGRALIVEPEPEVAPLSIEERIRARAYEIYLERGGEHGSHLEDWLQAEAEVTAANPE